MNPTGRKDRATALQIGALAITFLYAIFFDFLRPFGILPLAAALAAAAYLTLFFARRYVEPLLLAFTGLGAVYVAASYAELFSRGNTILFEPSAIPQQASYLLALPLLVPSAALFCQYLIQKRKAFLRLETFLFLATIVGEILSYSPEWMLGTSTNRNIVFLFILFRRLTYTDLLDSRQKLFLVFIVLTCMIFFGKLQSIILLMGYFLFRFSPGHKRSLLLGLIISMTVVSIASIAYAESLWELDANTGVRGLLWRDVLYNLVATQGFGVGFGTETISPVYNLSVRGVAVVSIEAEGFIFVGSHNAFMDAAFRMGLFGFAISIWYIGRHIVPTIRKVRSTTFDCWVAAALFMLVMVNVGLASANHYFGASLLLGWLLLRQQARKSLSLV